MWQFAPVYFKRRFLGMTWSRGVQMRSIQQEQDEEFVSKYIRKDAHWR
jgi:hypothetical protein